MKRLRKNVYYAEYDITCKCTISLLNDGKLQTKKMSNKILETTFNSPNHLSQVIIPNMITAKDENER